MYLIRGKISASSIIWGQTMQTITQPALSAALAKIAAAESKAKAKAKAKSADSAAAKQIAHRQISISMPAVLLAEIEKQADALHMPRATFIKMLLAQGVAAAPAPAPASVPAPAPVPAPVLTRTAGHQAATLKGLAGLGVDITGATGLAGAELDAWIDAAEEAGFQREFAEFQEQRRAMHTK